MNQQFWRNHAAQDVLPERGPDPSPSRLAAVGHRSLSAESSQDAELRKYMPAGQRVAQRGSLLDETTGLVNVNQQPTGGVWSLMMDGSAVPVEPVRRMRAKPQQGPVLAQEDIRLVEKMQWNPQVEAQHAAKREYIEQKWANAPSTMPGQNSEQMVDTVRSRRPAQNGQGSSNSSISLGWNETPTVQQPPPPMSERSPAPWMQEADTFTARSSRRNVHGVDHNKSKISWQGYGNNDPSLAVNEPIGVMRENDNDCFAIGNARAEKFILKSGRIRASAPVPKQDSLNLRDDAYTNQSTNYRPSVAQVSPRHKDFFNVASHGMANPNNEAESLGWAPSGQERRAPQGLHRTQGMAKVDHMGRPIHIPAPQKTPPKAPSPQQVQYLSPRRAHEPLSPPRQAVPEPAPWGMNYEEKSHLSQSSCATPLITPFDVEGAPVPTNIHFHTLNTTQAHPPPQAIPGQPSLPDTSLRAMPSRVREGQNLAMGDITPRGYAKAGPGFGHMPLTQNNNYAQQQQSQNQQQYEHHHNQQQQQQQQPPQRPQQLQYDHQFNQQQEQPNYQQQNSHQQQCEQQQHEQHEQLQHGQEQMVDFTNLSSEDNTVIADFVEWYQSSYGDMPPAIMVSRAVIDARSKRPPPQDLPMVPPMDSYHHPRLSPLQSPKSSRRVDGADMETPPEKKMGGRSFAMGSGGGAPTMNQNNSILGRRSTRVAAPPGGVSSFSLGGF